MCLFWKVGVVVSGQLLSHSGQHEQGLYSKDYKCHSVASSVSESLSPFEDSRLKGCPVGVEKLRKIQLYENVL